MWFWLRASPKVAVKIVAGAVALQGLAEEEESITRQLTHKAGKFVLAVLAVGMRPWFFNTWTSPQGFLSLLPESPKENDTK